jgi:hypothetical protein
MAQAAAPVVFFFFCPVEVPVHLIDLIIGALHIVTAASGFARPAGQTESVDHLDWEQNKSLLAAMTKTWAQTVQELS